MHGQSNMHAIPLPDDIPWGQTVGLLLDAISIKELTKRLYEWTPAPELDVLYHGTQWHEISQLSPCLVRVRDRNNPILLQFLANTSENWGYLLISDRPWAELLAHMRWLTSIHPPACDEMYVRISSQDVAQALFDPEQHPGPDLFGPCQRIVVGNYATEGWQQYWRPGDQPVADYRQPYTLNDAQWTALQAIEYRRSVRELYQHMNHFFPHYRADLTPAQRLERAGQLVESAIEQGFRKRREIWLYANVFGYLGDDVLTSHPDIAELLTQKKSSLTPHQRVNQAAALASERSPL